MELPYLRTTKLKEAKKKVFMKAQKEYQEAKLSRILNSPFAGQVSLQRMQEIKEKMKENNNSLEL